MYLHCLSMLAIGAIFMSSAAGRTLRVCADPNNLPFSNEKEQGFENRLASMIARELGADLEYTWWSQHRAFIKNSLNAGRCDVILGVPTDLASLATTAPYYRSMYVFVTRKNQNDIISLNDERLAKCRIGLHRAGNDYTPPGFALAHRGLSANIVGFGLYGRLGEIDPPARIFDAVLNGIVDVAIVWGPLAGYFSREKKNLLTIQPITPSSFQSVPFAYSISAGVRKEDQELKTEIDKTLRKKCMEIQALLDEYEVPQAQGTKPLCESLQASASLR